MIILAAIDFIRNMRLAMYGDYSYYRCPEVSCTNLSNIAIYKNRSTKVCINPITGLDWYEELCYVWMC